MFAVRRLNKHNSCPASVYKAREKQKHKKYQSLQSKRHIFQISMELLCIGSPVSSVSCFTCWRMRRISSCSRSDWMEPNMLQRSQKPGFLTNDLRPWKTSWNKEQGLQQTINKLYKIFLYIYIYLNLYTYIYIYTIYQSIWTPAHWTAQLDLMTLAKRRRRAKFPNSSGSRCCSCSPWMAKASCSFPRIPDDVGRLMDSTGIQGSEVSSSATSFSADYFVLLGETLRKGKQPSLELLKWTLEMDETKKTRRTRTKTKNKNRNKN